MRRVPPHHSSRGSTINKSLTLALGLALGGLQVSPAFARDDDWNSYSSNNRYQDYQNQYKPQKNFTLTSQLDRQIQTQNAALQFRFGQRIEPNTPSFSFSATNTPTLPQPKFQFGASPIKPLDSFKIDIPKPQAVSRPEPKGLLGAIGNGFKAVINTVSNAFQKIGQAIGRVVQFFSVDKAKVTYQVQRDRVLKENPGLREVSPGAFQVPQNQTTQFGGRTWEPGSIFQLNKNGRGISLTEGVTMSPDLGGIRRSDGNPLPVKMVGENGAFKPIGIDFGRIDPKTSFNFTTPVKIDGVGDIPAGASMTYEGMRPGTKEDPTPVAILSFQNARINNPQGALEALGKGKEPITLGQMEMRLKGAINQISGMYLTRGGEKLYTSQYGEVFSVTQLEKKSSGARDTSNTLTRQSKKLTDDVTSAVLHSNTMTKGLHDHTGTPETTAFQVRAPVTEQAAATKAVQVKTNVLSQHMANGHYGEVANAITEVETAQGALKNEIKAQQAQVETFQQYKRAVKGFEQAYGKMANQADPESMKAKTVTADQIKDAAGYFPEQKNQIRIQTTNALKALDAMEAAGVITTAENALKSVEIIGISRQLLAARPDKVGNAVIKTADKMQKSYEGVSKDFDQAIFDHLDNLAGRYPRTMQAVGQGALAFTGGAAIVGLGYAAVTAPATTAVVVGSGVISQKTFEAMGLSKEASAFYTAIIIAPVGAAAGQSESLQNADKSIIVDVKSYAGRIGTWISREAKQGWEVVTNEHGNIAVPGQKQSNINVAGLNQPSTFQPIKTPYGDALQSTSHEAVAARSLVQRGQTLYKIGRVGKGETAEAQFWALENPLSPGYPARYGMPPGNLKPGAITFVELGKLKPGTPFITRQAPPVGTNPGGGIEVVVPPGGVEIESFSAGRRRP